MQSPTNAELSHRSPKATAIPCKRRGSRVRRIAAFCGAAFLAWVLAGSWLFAAPQTDAPQSADVLFVLGPPDDRIAYAEQLMATGDTDVLAVSSPVDEDGQFTAPICQAARDYQVLCFHPDPFTTQGEARSLQSMSRDHGWKTVNVLAPRHHITRARVLLERCYQGELRMIEHDSPLSLQKWAYLFAYHSAAFVKVALTLGC
jgi:hypothetical protein